MLIKLMVMLILQYITPIANLREGRVKGLGPIELKSTQAEKRARTALVFSALRARMCPSRLTVHALQVPELGSLDF